MRLFSAPRSAPCPIAGCRMPGSLDRVARSEQVNEKARHLAARLRSKPYLLQRAGAVAAPDSVNTLRTLYQSEAVARAGKVERAPGPQVRLTQRPGVRASHPRAVAPPFPALSGPQQVDSESSRVPVARRWPQGSRDQNLAAPSPHAAPFGALWPPVHQRPRPTARLDSNGSRGRLAAEC